MNAIDFEDFEPAIKGELVKKKLMDGWMIIHAYTVKVPIRHEPIPVFSEELFVAMGKPKAAQRFLAVDAPSQDWGPRRKHAWYT